MRGVSSTLELFALGWARTTTWWDAWVLVLALVGAAVALRSRQRTLARVALAAALVLSGLAAFFVGVP